MEPAADTNWRRRKIPTNTNQVPSPPALKLSSETDSPQRFKIDWPAPDTAAKTQSAAAYALPAMLKESLQPENWKDNCVCDPMLLARFIDILSNLQLRPPKRTNPQS